MKYYCDFYFNGNNAPPLPTTNKSSIPTDPQFQQDGVYNQRCKYRLTNFLVGGATNNDNGDFDGFTLLIRFPKIPVYNSFKFFDNASVGLKNPNVLEFSLRMGGNKYQNNGNSLGTNDTGHNNPAGNSFSEEYIGGTMWGQQPEIEVLVVDNDGVESSTEGTDVFIQFTLELEPVAIKL